MVWLQDGVQIAANEPEYRSVWDDKPKPQSDIQIYHCHNDHLGTPNELTTHEGEVVWLADYEAWGNTAKVVWREEKLGQLQVSAEELQPIRFQGQSLDEETGLHYNRFRYYDPDLGMFISRDPISLLGGVNTFAYAPNPVGWIDPFGLSKKNCDLSALKAPHPRHHAQKVKIKTTAKAVNTVVDTRIVNINNDVVAIRKGLAIRKGNNFILPNGNVYGRHDCNLYPISGPRGIYTLDRGEYKALGHFNQLGEKEAERILKIAGYNQKTIDKGKEIWKIIN